MSAPAHPSRRRSPVPLAYAGLVCVPAVSPGGLGVVVEHLDVLGEIDDDSCPLLDIEVAALEGVGEDLPHPAGHVPVTLGQVGDHLVAAPEQMGKAGLVGGLLELALRPPAVADDDAGIVGVDHLGGLLEAAAALYHCRRSYARRTAQVAKAATSEPCRYTSPALCRVFASSFRVSHQLNP